MSKKNQELILTNLTEYDLAKIIQANVKVVLKDHFEKPASTTKYITDPQLQEMTGYSKSHTYRLRKDGKIPFTNSGKSVRYKLQDVLDFMEIRNSPEGESHVK